MLVKAEGDFPVSVEGGDPLRQVLGYASLLHDLLECCWVDLVEGTLDVMGENGLS